MVIRQSPRCCTVEANGKSGVTVGAQGSLQERMSMFEFFMETRINSPTTTKTFESICGDYSRLYTEL